MAAKFLPQADFLPQFSKHIHPGNAVRGATCARGPIHTNSRPNYSRAMSPTPTEAANSVSGLSIILCFVICRVFLAFDHPHMLMSFLIF